MAGRRVTGIYQGIMSDRYIGIRRLPEKRKLEKSSTFRATVRATCRATFLVFWKLVDTELLVGYFLQQISATDIYNIFILWS